VIFSLFDSHKGTSRTTDFHRFLNKSGHLLSPDLFVVLP
jgi:hypothetical protein